MTIQQVRRAVAASVMLAVLSGSLSSAASEECVQFFEKGQALEQANKLLSAREKFHACIPESCGKNLPKDCLARYEALLPRIPTVVLEAVRGDEQLVDVEVSIDGSVVANRLEGRALEVDPGEHVFVFTSKGETVTEKRVILESKKGQSVKASFPVAKVKPVVKPVATSAANSAEPPKVGDAGSEARSRPPQAIADAPKTRRSSAPARDERPEAHGDGGGLRSGLIYGGFGVAGAGVLTGVISGWIAITKAEMVKSSCPNQQCLPAYHSVLDGAKTAATVSTVGFSLAVLGVGVGVYGLLSGDAEPPKAGEVRPWIGVGSVGLTGAF